MLPLWNLNNLDSVRRFEHAGCVVGDLQLFPVVVSKFQGFDEGIEACTVFPKFFLAHVQSGTATLVNAPASKIIHAPKGIEHTALAGETNSLPHSFDCHLLVYTPSGNGSGR